MEQHLGRASHLMCSDWALKPGSGPAISTGTWVHPTGGQDESMISQRTAKVHRRKHRPKTSLGTHAHGVCLWTQAHLYMPSPELCRLYDTVPEKGAVDTGAIVTSG
jgi:hypothetical protein